MLSYQHNYHAGNAADVHKHALLATTLAYMTRKDKALTYMESHAGRGLYDLSDAAARRTGESDAGVTRLLTRFPPDHPWRETVERTRAIHGSTAYPGSPLIAQHLLRRFDSIELAELHPQEYARLVEAMPKAPNTRLHKRDGLEMAKALTPPDPRRGCLMIDPSWEMRDDYGTLAKLVPLIHRKWNVGVILLWYPLLADQRHKPMVSALRAAIPDLFISEVRFPPAQAHHGMQGSAMAVVNTPWGLEQAAQDIAHIFERT
ncbi:ribosomal RNA large subunit methyltransferase J [Jannaschia pagri]|uniref:Ribosomal RNA large subunit methyltransferase J n=1 Tax=Jannaschia pagri TaxID=2829797 RepID=A0ABQ4NHF9_9RHOB|nr:MULTISPECIES: 23S rRNA (adenine(2030)-N(6))-methyltransferase RlmJ [unclassified Jannaschia]GIT90043.1 ribosomal RNA large subunit methyltransferase J [Jannaschia sp. AI_61]GIT93851.1 ribosomal RNA large subunit methyltransferase J [Jannaschia sp. AI_62]